MSKAPNAGYCVGIAALLVLFGSNTLQNAVANGDTRTISFHHIHLKEDTTITYKVNGRYDAEALKKISWALRDWRTNAPTQMDPHLIDALWEVYREVGATQPIHVIGGYRSPATNAMLRRRSSGVAKYSQHMRGKAIDFFIPGVPLSSIREAGLRLQKGGVGFYPSSGAPFVHMDTGSVRHWPRMPEAQLARVMAKGPLTQVASKNKVPSPANLFANLFGGGNENESETTTATASSRTAAEAPAGAAKQAAVVAYVPIPPVRPAVRPAAEPSGGMQLASASSRPVPAPTAAQQPAGMQLASASSRPVLARPAVASGATGSGPSANEVINERGYWRGLVEPTEVAHLTARARNNAPAKQTASAAEPKVTGSVASASLSPWPMPSRSATGAALAYAPPVAPASSRSAPPMGKAVSRTAPRDTTVVVKGKDSRPATVSPPLIGPDRLADRLNDPWMRAMIVSPNAQRFMKTSLLGAPDYRHLEPQLHKPITSVMMTFCNDPHLGMSTEEFRGHAVVFVATVTFNRQHASLH